MKIAVCFVAGTMVLTAAGLVAIEHIRTGNKVISTNAETCETGEKPVINTFTNESSELVHVFVNDEEIIATPSHLFYVADKGWIPAARLSQGSVLLLPDASRAEVERAMLENLEEPVKVYNFEVADWHTYHVGNISILVHNDCKYEINTNGDIEITDWGDYPKGFDKPSSNSLKIIEGQEYKDALKLKNAANGSIHRTDPSVSGMQIHEVHPVKFGGSPTDIANKVYLSPIDHNTVSAWWRSLQHQVKNK